MLIAGGVGITPMVSMAQHIANEGQRTRHRWNAGDATILEVAESHGITPDFGCRNGVCGTCRRKLLCGSVTYRTQPAAAHDNDEVLICCAVPARGTAALEIAL